MTVLNEIYTDTYYVYAALDDRLDILEIETEQKGAYISHPSGFTTVWGNDTTVFVGTTNSGVKYLNKSDISINTNTPVNLSDYLNDFIASPNITSNNVKHLCGRNNNELMCCTISGVDCYKFEPYGYRSYTTCSGAYRCFMPRGNSAYYLTSSGTHCYINKINYTLMDWAEPDEIFTIDIGLRINDIFVTEGTAEDSIKNTLFIATSSGVYVVDESTYETDIYYTAG